ncbi:MAG: hypothetical protein OK436_01620 [Thaumarchaeota archaeon]|nr:hypothetical protein [Nitrososphaerota archaeon]
MNIILAGLMATAALVVIVVGYLVLSVPITQVGNADNRIFPNVNLNGVSMASFVSNQFALFGAAIVLAITAVIIWFFYAVHSDEYDSGVLG